MNEPLSEGPATKLEDVAKVPVQDVVVDILGSLVPGILYTTALFPAIILPINILVERLTGGAGHLLDTTLFSPFSTTAAIAIAVFGLIFAYVIGHLFFRQNPAVADHASWQRVRLPNEIDPGAYPYINLREELLKRGLGYLAEHVPWSATNESSHHRSSKHFVNALKIRLALSFPSRIGTIARNEAHIRLSSSLWHGFRALVRPALVGLVIGVVANVVDTWRFAVPLPPPALIAVLMPGLVLFAVRPVTRAIERALHYQRRREIFFILETAYWAGRCHPRINLFQGLGSDPKLDSDREQAG